MTDTYQSIMELAYRYNPEDITHMEQDAHLATTIFRLTRGLHQLPQEYEELLEYAALLHDIGYYYGYDAHHKHAYRMIMEADIPGLNEREKSIVANVARYHRSAGPSLNIADLRRFHSMTARSSPGWAPSCAWPTVWTVAIPTRSRG